MNRILKINNQIVDIDEQTALGIDLQTYDITEPAQPKVSVSNSFTLPITNNNRYIFGFADSPYNISDYTMYEEMTFDYWVDNEQLVKSARARVIGIKERITLFIFEKQNIWDRLKKTNLRELVNDFLTFVIFKKDFFRFDGTLKELLTFFSGNDPDVVPYKFSRCNSLLSIYNPVGTETPLEDYSSLWLSYDDDNDDQTQPIAGGHIFIFCKSLFEFFEYKFGVSFSTNDEFAANIFYDDVAKQTYTNVFPELTVSYSDAVGDEGWRMNINGSFKQQFADGTIKEVFGNIEKPLADYTCFDFVSAFIKTFNCIVDSVEPNVFKIRRFDQLETDAQTVDFSKNLDADDIPEFKPEISGIAQENKVKFSSVYDNGSEDVNSRIVECNNLNIEATNDSFVDINFHIPVINIKDQDDAFVNLGSEESLQTPSILIDGAKNLSAFTVGVKDIVLGTEIANFAVDEIPTTQLVGLADEYQLYEKIINRPYVLNIRKWLSITEVANLEFFKLYSIPILGGSFFINKISGFNTESKQATEISLIKINNKILLPVTSFDSGVWALDKNTAWKGDSNTTMLYERQGKFYDSTYNYDGEITY
jgi:hypothetical protein